MSNAEVRDLSVKELFINPNQIAEGTDFEVRKWRSSPETMSYLLTLKDGKAYLIEEKLKNEEVELIYLKDRINWINYYVDEAYKEIQSYEDDISRLTEEKQILNEKLKNLLQKK